MIDVQAYEQFATIPKETASRLLSRLDYLKIEPKIILDLGCRTGLSTQALKSRYPQAMVVAVDESFEMLKRVKKQQSWFKKQASLQAHAQVLPFKNESIDLIFANQLPTHSQDLSSLFEEFQRIMSPLGCLMFSSLGPDTLKEIEGRPAYVDLHDVGDALLRCGFQDPVMDREDLSLQFRSKENMQKVLAVQGLKFNVDAKLTQVSYEIIYGHAWRGRLQRKDDSQVISIAQLKQSLQKNKNNH